MKRLTLVASTMAAAVMWRAIAAAQVVAGEIQRQLEMDRKLSDERIRAASLQHMRTGS